MTRIGVAEFKARLSEHLRRVRSGEELTILDRDQPVARVVPHASTAALEVREPVHAYDRLGQVPLPRVAVSADPMALLLEDRARR